MRASVKKNHVLSRKKAEKASRVTTLLSCGNGYLATAFIAALLCAVLLLTGGYVQAAKSYQYADKPEERTFSNGNTGYYIKKNNLYKYTYKNKKAKKLKKLNKKLGLYISAVYGKNVYMTSENFDKWSLKTYTYNMKSKKVKYTKAKVAIMSNKGQYALTEDEFRSDVSPYKTSLYKLTNSGMKKIKTLAYHGMGAYFINDKIYYTNYPLDGKDDASGMSKMEIYICDKNGSNPELVTTITDEHEFGYVFVEEMNAGHCDLKMLDGDYRFIFDSKHLEKRD